ncbi:MAG: biopolymer transporter ExbD [Alphaproteobacteria bacterium]
MIHSDDHLHFEGYSRTPLSVNITPLIDIVFLLLVFFMLATSFFEAESVILRLSAGAPTAARSPDTVVVEVTADGAVRLNGAAIDVDRLTPAVRALIGGDSHRQVSLRAERSVPVQRTVQIMDRIREAGSENIRFVTRTAEPRP